MATSLLTLRDDVLAMHAAAATALALTSAALATTSPTAAQLGACMTALVSAASSIRTIRATLDGCDVTLSQVYDDAAVTLLLWQWERGVRASLSDVEHAIQAGQAAVGELLGGIKQTLHTVRTGETLQSIAATYLGAWSEWPRISAANGLRAGPVAVGTVLVIPQRV